MAPQQASFRAHLHWWLKAKSCRFAVLVFLAIYCFYAFGSASLFYRLSPLVEDAIVTSNELAIKTVAPAAVGKVHALFGGPNPTYERALTLHRAHAKHHGYPMFVCREKILSGLWTKPAYVLSIILAELAKPQNKRLHWLLWIDADVVLMNSQISLDMFIPPSPNFDYVNLLVTHDRNGLNGGVFLIKVNEWSVKLLTAVLAFHHFKPQVALKYSEQSALEEMIKNKDTNKSVVKVPQYWFNAYPPSIGKKQEESVPLKAREFHPGGLQIHFAGNRNGKRPDRMNAWMDIAQQLTSNATWRSLGQQALRADIEAFWAGLVAERAAKGIVTTSARATTIAIRGNSIIESGE